MEPRKSRSRWSRRDRPPRSATERSSTMGEMSALQPGSETGARVDQLSAREPGDLQPGLPGHSLGGPQRAADKLKPETNGSDESDSLLVAMSSANAGAKRGAEGAKETGQGERVEDHRRRTLGGSIRGNRGL